MKVQDRILTMDPADMRVLASEEPVEGERKVLVLEKSTLFARPLPKFACRIGPWTSLSKLTAKMF